MTASKSQIFDTITDRILYPTDNSTLEYETTQDHLQYKKDRDTYGDFAVGSLKINNKSIIDNDRNVATEELLPHDIGTPEKTTYYGDGQYLENITVDPYIPLAYPITLFPEFKDCMITDYSTPGNSKVIVDFINTDLNYPYYSFKVNNEDYDSITGNQFVTLKLFIIVPDNFSEFSDDAINIYICTTTNNSSDNCIDFFVGKVGQLSYYYNTLMVSDTAETWKIFTIDNGYLMGGATPIQLFETGDIIELKFNISVSDVNEVKLSYVNVNFE